MLRMIKVCPRCGGNMLLNNDLYGWYEQCLQCSYLRDLDDIFRVKEQPMEQVDKSELAQYWENKY